MRNNQDNDNNVMKNNSVDYIEIECEDESDDDGLIFLSEEDLYFENKELEDEDENEDEDDVEDDEDNEEDDEEDDDEDEEDYDDEDGDDDEFDDTQAKTLHPVKKSRKNTAIGKKKKIEKSGRKKQKKHKKVASTKRKTTSHGRSKRGTADGIWGKLWNKLKEMDNVDRMVAATGTLVLLIATITGTVYVNAKAADKQVAAFTEIGLEMEGIEVIGESGLLAVADAQAAKVVVEEALQEALQEAAAEAEEKEAKEKEAIEVSISLTSMQKDLKIKFTDKKTGKLISDVVFGVTVTGEGNKTYSWKDENKDGIIYHTDMKPGKYSVVAEKAEESDKYKISTESMSITVKDKIEYKKVDVTAEMKKESEVNASKEDTKQEEVVESVLTDTVEWVESTKTAANGNTNAEGYEEVQREKVTDPKTVASAGRFLRFAAPDGMEGTGKAVVPEITVSLNKTSISLTVGGSDSLAATTAPEGNTVEWVSSDASVATVANGTITAVAAGNASITAKTTTGNSASCTVSVANPAPTEIKVTIDKASVSLKVGENASLVAVTDPAGKEVTWESDNAGVAAIANGTITAVAEGTATIKAKTATGNSASCTVTVVKAETPPPTAITVLLDKASLSLKIGESASVVATTTPAGNKVEWASTNVGVATVVDGKITAIAAGTANITAKTSTENIAVCAVTVVAAAQEKPTIVLSAATGKILTGQTLQITATVANAVDKTVVWSTNNEAVATVDQSGVVKGITAGTAVITAACKADSTVMAVCNITVVKDPSSDSTTKLKDNEGNQLYVKNSDGSYREAVYSDYAAGSKLYKKSQNVEYRYTGWQTIDGKTYYFTKDGNKVTGEQVIQGARYNFDGDGALSAASGNLGIDVSKWNGNIDWNAVRNSGISYAIIRCGYRGSTTGALIEDPTFRANIKGASAAGIKVGIYFFTQAVNEVEAVEEASMVLSQISGYKISYPVFLDVEASSGRGDRISKEARTEVCKAFCQTIQNAGYKAGVYSNKTWFNQYLNAGSLTGYKIWLAQYAAAPTYTTTRYDLWQYSAKGAVSGIKGNVDMNISYLGY